MLYLTQGCSRKLPLLCKNNKSSIKKYLPFGNISSTYRRLERCTPTSILRCLIFWAGTRPWRSSTLIYSRIGTACKLKSKTWKRNQQHSKRTWIKIFYNSITKSKISPKNYRIKLTKSRTFNHSSKEIETFMRRKTWIWQRCLWLLTTYTSNAKLEWSA